ncbi:class I SAM-dependent methyltransferase [Paenibacillus psychroresistens]|uniref:Class I SAM-dependent methyltransferase n=1 Tax=Paenibacillus psychroresistens TaxID=1778678 RepID=A0A6B8RRU8_9BACL|nr:cyclopropane-fatty-acyl-phospholipid synthase family protein [Paenibacillus psychroresistens]QGQ98534.1 class I SAM-dependent methyltransferase [Paenibacillus psychroresistens]
MWTDNWLEKNRFPDFLIRIGIRRLLKQRLKELEQARKTDNQYMHTFTKRLRQKPIAVHTTEANQQHYEVPTSFFFEVLGKQLKYSSGYWADSVSIHNALEHLDASEEHMLKLTCQRAGLVDGQEILELGCGWGSLSIYMASNYPQSQITVVSNSASQKAYIDQAARERGLTNLNVITADMNDLELEVKFARIVSVEMFEHMQNYALLLEKLNRFLLPDGKLFVHIFTHQSTAYLFEVQDETDWMAKYFFTGGMMPSVDIFAHFNHHLVVEQQWKVNGKHYQKTCEAWLQKMDAHRQTVMPILVETYGVEQATKWWVYWRVFFMSCAELFGLNKGNEWFVSHYLLGKRGEVT